MTDSDEHQVECDITPDHVPRPEAPITSFPVLAILVGIAVSMLLGIVLFVADQFVYIYILYNVVIGFAIGRAIALAPERSKYTNRGVLLSLTAFCSALVYLVFSVAIYLLVFDGAETEGISGWAMRIGHFIGILMLRAANEPFLFGIELETAGTFVVWATEFGITFYVAWRQVSAGIRTCRADRATSEPEFGRSLTQTSPVTKYFWRFLWLVYGAFFVFLVYSGEMDSISLGYNQAIVALSILANVFAVLGIVLYAFRIQPKGIQKLWKWIFPVIAIDLITGFIMDAIIPIDYSFKTDGLEWLIGVPIILLIVFPSFYANYRLAYKDIVRPGIGGEAKLDTISA